MTYQAVRQLLYLHTDTRLFDVRHLILDYSSTAPPYDHWKQYAECVHEIRCYGPFLYPPSRFKKSKLMHKHSEECTIHIERCIYCHLYIQWFDVENSNHYYHICPARNFLAGHPTSWDQLYHKKERIDKKRCFAIFHLTPHN